MRTKPKLTLLLMLALIFSCDEPDTILTDHVHADGSVTREIEMKSSKNKFEKSVLQVPFDSTWIVTDSTSIGPGGDTLWIKKAVKLFRNAGEINETYKNDSSSNGKFPRHVSFTRKFNWFNTSYRFSEIIDKRMASGSSVKNFLNEDELLYFYAPENLKNSKLHGPDSLKYKSLSDSIEQKTWNWTLKNFSTMWIEDFSRLTAGRTGPELSEDSLKAGEAKIIDIVNEYNQFFDSLWASGFLLRKMIGEPDASKFRREADSALTLATNSLLIDYKNYSVRISMPGKLTRTNGYADSSLNLIWPVNADLFLSDNYEMWAESKTSNPWAWIVSGIFIVFVFAGIIVKKKVPPGRRD